MIERLLEKLASLKFFALIDADEIGVHTRCGKVLRKLSPGFYWRLPVIDNIYYTQGNIQTMQMADQSNMTTDGQSIMVGIGISYRVIDADKAILETEDYEERLNTIARDAVASFISMVPYDKCTYSNLIDEVKDELEVETSEFGVEIIRVYLSDMSKHRVIRLIK